jgi:hypothetical protein
MTDPTLGVAAFAALGFAHLLAIGIGLWLRRTGSEVATDPSGSVRCPDCGATNEAGYRYCRNCVAELPGSSPYTPSTGPGRSALSR